MESIADRVDLVKRASEATIEITRQMGAELALAQGEIRHGREDLEKATAEVRTLLVANQSVDSERKRERRGRLAAEQLLASYVEAIGKMRKVFGPGFGPGETAAFERLTPPQRRALDHLLSLPAAPAPTVAEEPELAAQSPGPT